MAQAKKTAQKAASKSATQKAASKSSAQKAASKGAKQPQDRQPKQQTNGQVDDAIFRITYQGCRYEVGLKDLTDREARRFRREHGVSLRSALEDPDIDVFITLVWLMDLRDDPTLSRDDYDGTMTYSDLYDEA